MVISTNIKPFFLNYFDLDKINTTAQPINIGESSKNNWSQEKTLKIFLARWDESDGDQIQPDSNFCSE